MSQAFVHEEVLLRRGPRSGLPIIVALHSRALGPAAGGCRLRRYDSWQDGLADALKLSEAMTYKAAVAGLDFGGGKTVIALDNETDLTAELRQSVLEDLGEIVASLGGSYLIGPDIGTGPADMSVLRRFSPYACCTPESEGGTGDSSPPTAVGVLAAIRAGVKHVYGAESTAGRTVVVSGLGAVGGAVAKGLAAEGARVIVSDIDPARKSPDYEWVEPEEAFRISTDILVPAAVGGVLNNATIPELTAHLVVGPANNQLSHEAAADALADRGIIWVPDYVASAGGIVYTLARESEGDTHEQAHKRVLGIGDTVGRVLELAGAAGITPHRAARQIAAERLGLG